MSKLMDKLLSAGSVKHAATMSSSAFFNKRDMVQTAIPALNLLFSGSLSGGLSPGLTIFAGLSKTFKTCFCLYTIAAYLKKYEDGVCIFYDAEFGVTPDYLKSFGIDPDRMIHVPIEHIEQLKFDIVKRLEQINRSDHVIILVDSIGNLASKKEIEDAANEKSVADMTRAKAIRSLFRIMTPHLTIKDIPCLVVAHVYQTMELYAKTIMGGGTSLTYSANQIFFVTRSQDKDKDELSGYFFKLKVEKSRFVREGSVIPIGVSFEGGINKWSGLLEIALEMGIVTKPANGWYTRTLIDKETGEVKPDKKFREVDTDTDDFWLPILTETDFAAKCRERYRLGEREMLADDESLASFLENDDE